jgi:hypothetical protein
MLGWVRQRTVIVFLAGALPGAACGGGGEVSAPPAAVKIIVTGSTVPLVVGQSETFAAEARDARERVVTGVPFTWSSSAEGVATVSSSGRVTAIALGEAIISASSGTLRGDVTVRIEPGGVIQPTGGEVSAFQGSVTISAAPGAVTTSTAVRISRIAAAVVDANVVQGSAYNVDVAGSFPPSLRMSIRYDPTVRPDGFPESALALHHVEPGVGFVVAAGSVVDDATHVVSAMISRGGFYAVRRATGQPGCASPPPDDLAFFIGSWNWIGNTGVSGSVAVTSEQGSCVISEFQNMRTDDREYSAVLLYDAATAEWRRTAIDRMLNRTVQRGKREGSRLVLYSQDRTRRHILEPLGTDRVLERDEELRDNGQSWVLVEGGEYRRKQ